MELLAPIFAGVGVLLIVVGLLRELWNPAIEAVEAYNDAIRFHDPISASIIAFAGGQQEGDEIEDYDQGITSEIHTFLRLSKEQYKRSTIKIGIFTGILGAVFFLILGAAPFSALILGVGFGFFSWFLVIYTGTDRIQRMMGDQVRQFPFFLDIFLLTVQANGNLEDSIKSYNSIFGYNAISQELMILREDLKSHNMIDSFDRLRNRIGNEGLRNILGELTQKLRTGTELQKTLEQQSLDMRTLREELGAQAAERLNAKFNIPVVLSAVAVLLIFLAPAIAQMVESGFL